MTACRKLFGRSGERAHAPRVKFNASVWNLSAIYKTIGQQITNKPIQLRADIGTAP
jgi:hypothetical protein